MADLFVAGKLKHLAAAQPLAVRMRPRTPEEFVGQQHILGPGKMLRRMIQADQLLSVIFFGPPGTGKTTLAHLIAASTQRRFVQLNAAASGVKEVRDTLARARAELESAGRRTVLFIDEIHRFNRAQQDILLDDVEEGVVVLIGATTLNPFFAINAPLVSRSRIFQLEPLTEVDIRRILEAALQDPQRGFPGRQVRVTPEAMDFFVRWSDGDARRALSALELAVLSQPNAAGVVTVDAEAARESLQAKVQVYDATGDEHFDTASALIKSMRGSDPDAAVYWLARMLAGGEDPRFIARRVAICASEDIGNADPMAVVLAAAAVQIAEFVGLPECQLTLAQAVTYLACCPKSNAATVAIGQALQDVREQRTVPVPRPLRDANYRGATNLGHTGYQYAHNFPEGFAPQEYLGVDKHYYQPVARGHEKIFRAYLENIAALRAAADNNGPAAAPAVNPPDPPDHPAVGNKD
jgi:putative ATPase